MSRSSGSICGRARSATAPDADSVRRERRTMYFIKIDGRELPVPYYYSVTSKDIESSGSGRSDETGVVHRNRIRRSVRVCTVKWRIPGSALGQLDTDLSAELLDVSLLDPASAGYVRLDMYADNIRSEFYQQQNGSLTESWWDISCTLTEF